MLDFPQNKMVTFLPTLNMGEGVRLTLTLLAMLGLIDQVHSGALWTGVPFFVYTYIFVNLVIPLFLVAYDTLCLTTELSLFSTVISRYVGINATDINHSAGRYDPGKSPPLDAGLEVSVFEK